MSWVHLTDFRHQRVNSVYSTECMNIRFDQVCRCHQFCNVLRVVINNTFTMNFENVPRSEKSVKTLPNSSTYILATMTYPLH